LPKGATVLEFMPEDFAAYGHPFTFRNLASVASIQYAVSGMETHAKKTKWTPPQKTRAEVRLKIINADRQLDLNKLKRALQCVLD